MTRTLQGWLAVAVLSAAGAAQAGGLLLSPEVLPEQTRTELADQIELARSRNPDAFAKAQSIARSVKGMDARKRGRIAPVSPVFHLMGEDALWPVVELIAFDSRGVASTLDAESARGALNVGLIEAAGRLRNERVAPLWNALLDVNRSMQILRAAAEALARLDTDAAASRLVALSRTDGPVREAVLWGMGNCRRLTVARALVDALEGTRDPGLARRVVQSLGDVGSAWAWRTPSVKARSEEGSVRKLAAEALVRAYLTFSEAEVRQAASNALMVVDAPETPSLLKAAREGLSAGDLRALDGLANRFANNPTR